MNRKSKKKLWLFAGATVLIALIFYFTSSESDQADLTVLVTRGDLPVSVTTSGELEAKESEKILGPKSMRSVGVWQVKITDLVDEGTYVHKGDYIATLDRSEVANKLKELAASLEKAQTQLLAAKLDTALTLREARDQLINLKYGLEEKQLIVDQSKYEPPATIRQAEIDLEKANRGYIQTKKNYQLKLKQAKAKVAEKAADLRSHEIKFNRVQEVLDEFTITAPKDGMLVYHRDWEGQKIQVGSQISAWDPVVATLPDLTKMVSATYVNEIDISKVKEGQKVDIGVDAFPNKKYTGEIISVANVGEQMPNSDAKVFEVVVEVMGQDSILRPSMTTSNVVNIETHKDVLYIPIESVTTNDSISYVFRKDGLYWVRQQIEIESSNDQFIVVAKGLKEGEQLRLSLPKNHDDYELSPLL